MSVSVIIATRDRLAMLKDAVASVERQTSADWELLVVDDRSRDETAAWVSAHADPRVRLIRLDAHGERSRARNHGTSSAQGAYVIYLDDDDRLTPRAIEVLSRALDARAHCVAAVGAYVLTDGSGARRRGSHPRRTLERRLWRDSLFGWVAPQGRTLLRTEAVRAAGGFREDLSFAEDWDLWLRIVRGARVVSVPDVVLEYTLHAGQSGTDDGHAAIDELSIAHARTLTGHEASVAAKMRDVRLSHHRAMRALRDLEPATATRELLRAIGAAPFVLTSPFVRPQVLRPLAKAMVGLILGKRGTLAVRRAATRARRAAKRDVWSHTGG